VTIPFLDLRAEHEEIRADLDAAISRVIESGQYILGGEVAAFEDEFAAFCGVRNCVTVGNGTDALQLILRAEGIGRGDEVLVPAYTAVATWMAVSLVGATPVGLDVDPRTANIDASLVEAAITPRTRAVIGVHLFGRPADMDPLNEQAERHGLAVFEDAAQAHGARYRGRRVGSLARAAAFSFYPTKNLGAIGDGGAVTTDDDELADTVRRLRTYGWKERDRSELKGLNSRLDELQAAILRLKLSHLEAWNERRGALAARYLTTLRQADVDLPSPGQDVEPVWHLFVVGVDDRDRLRGRIARDFETLVHYRPLPHLTPAYFEDGWREGAFPVAERLSSRALSLPLYPQLSPERCDAVAAGVTAATRT
jgi:dTDP-3-amino-3,4,6-trideoxy-alpha-D-glucose transaminase